MLNEIAKTISIAWIIASASAAVAHAGPQYRGGPKSFSDISSPSTPWSSDRARFTAPWDEMDFEGSMSSVRARAKKQWRR
jgi:hypothetical protein